MDSRPAADRETINRAALSGPALESLNHTNSTIRHILDYGLLQQVWWLYLQEAQYGGFNDENRESNDNWRAWIPYIAK